MGDGSRNGMKSILKQDQNPPELNKILFPEDTDKSVGDGSQNGMKSLLKRDQNPSVLNRILSSREN